MDIEDRKLLMQINLALNYNASVIGVATTILNNHCRADSKRCQRIFQRMQKDYLASSNKIWGLENENNTSRADTSPEK